MPLSVWKFMIGTDEIAHDPDEPTVAYSGLVAAVVAASREDALARLDAYIRETFETLKPGWLRVARVTQLPIEDGAVVVVAAV